ncbi:MAG: aldehyde dehydrogenase family protein [Chloroflexota bacterium]
MDIRTQEEIEETMPDTFQNFINGAWADSSSGQTHPSVNPADTSDVIAEFQSSTPEDADAAVNAASEAARTWGRMSAVARGGYLLKAANWLQQNAEEYAQALSRECGKGIGESRGEIGRAVAILQYYGVEGMNPIGDVVPSANPNMLLYTTREPLGVVGLITPWNFPYAIPIWKMAPAMIYGNTIVLKPASATPHMGALIARMWQEAELPPGVFNVVTGSGRNVGDPIVTHPKVRGISFTGSGAIGQGIAVAAAKRNIKYQLEMGGKNPVIVMPDPDLEQAAEITVGGAMKYAGQKCTATSRAIIAGDGREFTDLVVQKVNALKVGPGSDPDNVVVPVIDRAARDRIKSAIDAGVDAGANLLTGGDVLESGEYGKGHYVQPTVFDNVRPDAFIAQEEIFGPVLSIIPAGSADDAIDIANGVPYGLSASIFTKNLNASLEFANRIEAGIVKVNSETAGLEPQVPFGGMKESSSGSREQGKAAMEFFTETKTIYVDRSAT